MKRVWLSAWFGRHSHWHGHVGTLGALVCLVLAGHVPASAARPTIRPPQQTPRHAEVYSPNELLVKFAAGSRSKVREGDPRQTGIASIDTKLKDHRVTGFNRSAKLGRRSKASSEVFGWYTIKLDPSRPITAVQRDGQTVYPELEQLQAALATDTSVSAVTKNYQISLDVTPNDPFYGSYGTWGQGYYDMWGLRAIHADQAWDRTTGSSTVVVGVLDSGIDYTHPELASNIWTNPGEIAGNGLDDDGNGYVDDVHGWNWYGGNSNALDDHGHGTHVAGTIAASSNNASGVAGISWPSKVMSLKFIGAGGLGNTAGAIIALQYAADMGAKLTNNSWSCACLSNAAISDAVAYEAAANVVPVIAAGNNTASALDYYPAAADRGITVAATDSANAIASFSNTGPKVDISAPGVDILSLKSSGANAVCTGGAIVATSYCRLQGTSMASPHVAGVVALMLAQNPSLSTEQVRQILRSTAADLGTAGRDNTFGNGLLNADAAVAAASSPAVLTPVITAPLSRSIVGGSLAITGTAAGTGFASYKVEVGAGRTPGSWTTVTTSGTPVSNGTLATFATTTLSDGLYTFRLTATNGGGTAFEISSFDVRIQNIKATINTPINLSARATGVEITGSAFTENGLAFDHYTLEWGSGASPGSWSTAGITLANGGTSPVSSGLLGTWNTSALTDGGVYSLRLYAWAANTANLSAVNVISVTSRLVPGWPKHSPGANCDYTCNGAGAVLIDLDADGTKEVVVAGTNNQITAFRKNGTALAGWPATITAGSYFANQPIVADLDGDLKPEIIANAVTGPTSRQIYVWRTDGSLYPGWSPPTVAAASTYEDLTPSVADIDGDARPEMVLVNYEAGLGTRMHAWHADGTEAAGFPKVIAAAAPWLRMPVTITDLDSDGQVEIIYVTNNRLYALSGAGNVLSGWPVTLPNYSGGGESIQGPASIGDVNGDGQKEVIVSGQTNGMVGLPFRVYAYTKAGSLMPGWPYGASSSTFFAGLPLAVTTTADVDNDGKDEVLTGQYGDAIIDDGTGKKSIGSSLNSPGQLSIADFAGDGNLKYPAIYAAGIGWGSTDFSLYYYNSNFPTNTSAYGSFNAFMVADLDHNNQQEFSITNIYNREQYIYLLEMPGSTRPKDSWPMVTHDAARTSHYVAGQLVSDTSAPQVVLTTPAAGGSISGTVTVAANAIDDVGVTAVDFYDDATLIASDSTYPYSTSWNADTAAPGAHSLTAHARDAAANSSTSAAVGVTVVDVVDPASPANFNAGSATATTLSLSWDAATDNVGVTGYRLYRNGSQIAAPATPGYTDVGLTPTTSYTYAVEAVDAAGNVSVASGTTGTTTADTTAPAAPGGLADAGTTTTTASLTWSATTDDVAVTSYRIYRDGSLRGSVGPAVFSYTDTGLAPATSYAFTVRAADAASNLSAASGVLNLTTAADTTAPAAPTGLQASATSDTTINVAWTAASDDVLVTGYRVYRNGTLIGSPAGTSYNDSGLAPNTTYSYAVEAFDAAGNTSVQAAASLATDPDTTDPSAPGSLLVTAITTTGAHVGWSAASDDIAVAGYHVYTNGSLAATVAGISADLSGLTPATIYSVTVTAYDAAGNESVASSAQVFVTLSSPPTPTPTPTPTPVTVATPAKRGDSNGDHKVNLLDLSLVLSHYGRSTGSGDVDGNGRVDLFDLSIVLHEYGK